MDPRASRGLSTLLPSTAYVDITTPPVQGEIPYLTTSNLPQQASPIGTASCCQQKLQSQQQHQQGQSTLPSTQIISAPSEVSQNTAISDRPKVKPVSKKDGKNLRKSAAMLQQNQMVSIYNNLVRLIDL